MAGVNALLALRERDWLWLLLIGTVLLFWWADPLGSRQRQRLAEQELVARDKRQSELIAGFNQAQGEVSDRARLGLEQSKAAGALTQQALLEGRENEGAHQTLGDERIARIREHERGLCSLASELAGC